VLYVTGVYIAGVLFLWSPVAVPAMWVVVSAPEMCCLGHNVVSLWGRTYKNISSLAALDPKHDKLAVHIQICTLIPDLICQQALLMLERDGISPAALMTSVTSSSNLEVQPSNLKQCKTNSESINDHRPTEFSQDMCKLLVSCGIHWNTVSNPEMQLAIHGKMDSRHCCSRSVDIIGADSRWGSEEGGSEAC
jgi:hypothetical protein